MFPCCNIAFYVHHHGAGHMMRTLAIAKMLPGFGITLMGSNLKAYADRIPPEYNMVNLPMDTPEDDDLDFKPLDPQGLHYAPLNIRRQRERVNLMTDFFKSTFPLLLVVDVSVEVAMLATLCGVPFITVKQHGNRNDLPHLQAYHNAVGLLAPYPEKMKDNDAPWILAKTFFAGGISRYQPQPDEAKLTNKQIAIVIGRGGTSINIPFIQHLAKTCAEWHFNILGNLELTEHDYKNVSFLGNVTDPKAILARCAIVIGNAGHNTVMEVAALSKRFIVIPEERPFDEQVVKAEILRKLNLAAIVRTDELFSTCWHDLFVDTIGLKPDWSAIVGWDAASEAANYIKRTYYSTFKNSTLF
ncbi:glycosyltransferase [Pedobacter endophyticus]|uniref:Glycosyl transferase family 28 C-terminal domain-containing protein n=1 Tax=Pedobacter endophyticus TaxID=2789740 RepID=A0A7S9L1Q1_9SPHI|nr:glycosyltransferase [Pedobacter endophyticus]QPH40890.1 hypothetical protein IZT61_06390 [Pedobacter endophyticus]